MLLLKLERFKEALSELKSAAEAGWKSTEDMVAKIGRASRLGERSVVYWMPVPQAVI